jgi:hypothetical protein
VHTSGIITSTPNAAMLTFLFGESFRFSDTSEEYFSLPARTFSSFREAANTQRFLVCMAEYIPRRDRAGQSQATVRFIIQKISNIKPLEQ